MYNRILVVGENPENQMAPFEMCYSHADSSRYMKKVDETALFKKRWHTHQAVCVARHEPEDRLSFARFVAHSHRLVSHPNVADVLTEYCVDYAMVDAIGDVQAVYTFKNPNGKWDSFELYGSRDGCGKPPLKLHDGTRTNQARVKDVDWTGMKYTVKSDAERLYEEIRAATHHRSWLPIEHFRADPENMQADEQYWSQEAFIDFEGNGKPYWHSTLDHTLKGKAVFVYDHIMSYLHLDAYLFEGEWHGWEDMLDERMCLTDEERDAWREKYNNFVDALPGDELVTIFRFHS